MDYFGLLPVEIIEEIFSYLQGDDIINCSKVCNRWKSITDDDVFWQQFCLKKGHSKEDKQLFSTVSCTDTWREYFWAMNNWRNKKFASYCIQDTGAVEQAQLSGTSLIIPKRYGISVWNIKNVPFLEQELNVVSSSPTFQLRVSGEYIVYHSESIISVFIKRHDRLSLERIFYVKAEGEKDVTSKEELIEEYTDINAFLQNFPNRKESTVQFLINLNDDKLLISVGSLTLVWCLKTWEQYSVFTPHGYEVMYKVQIFWPKLYFVGELNNEYVIKVYDIPSGAWVVDLEHCYSESFIMQGMVPQVFVNDRYVLTSNTSGLINKSTIFVNVWSNKDGSLINGISLPGYFFTPFFSDELVILTSSCTILPWDPVKNKRKKHINLLEKEFTILNLLPNKLFLVSYSTHFEVWDLNTCSRLYKTDGNFVTKNSYNQRTNFLYCLQPDVNAFESLPPGAKNNIIVFNFRESLAKEDPFSS